MNQEERSSNKPYRKSLWNLNDRLGLDELLHLCYLLRDEIQDLEYDNLPGEGKRSKFIELVQFVERRSKLLILLDELAFLRPDLLEETKSIKQVLIGTGYVPTMSSYGQKPPITRVVHREEDWKFIQAEIRNRINSRSSSKSKSVIGFYGTAGIGKTTFLQETLIPRIKSTYPHLPFAVIDFDRDKTDQRYEAFNSRGLVVIDLLQSLAQNNDTRVDGREQVQQNWERVVRETRGKVQLDEAHRVTLSSAEEIMASIFCEYVVSLILNPDQRPIIIIVDTAEQASQELLGWIQEFLQLPTTDTGYVLWIMASRQRFNCQPFLLRDRYDWRHLLPFDRAQILNQVPERTDLAQILQRYSFGLPVATNGLASIILRIEQREEKRVSLTELVRVHDEEIISFLLSLVWRLGSLEQDLRAGLEVLSPLRYFTYSVAAKLLPKVRPDHFKRTSIRTDIPYIVQRMERTKLVYSDRVEWKYFIEEPVRQIIALIVQHDYLEDYTAIHRWAAEIYQEEAKNITAKRQDYIIEALYHKLIILILKQISDPALQLASTLEHILQEYHLLGEEQGEESLRALKLKLESDPDFPRLLQPEDMNLVLRPLLI